MTEKQKKLLLMAGVVGLALILPITLAVVGARQMWKESRAPQITPEHSAALQEAAERAADVALPVPTLASDAVVLECGPEDVEAQVQRVVRLSGGVGGAASSWNDGKTVRLLAKIPADAEKAFRDAVAQNVYDMKIAKGSERTTVVEVLIRPAEKTGPRKKKR